MLRLVVGTLCLAAALLAVPSAPGAVGESVSSLEGAKVYGAACADLTNVNRRYCYGGNCSSGGCGCKIAKALGSGYHKPAAATQCATSVYCTDMSNVTIFPCSAY